METETKALELGETKLEPGWSEGVDMSDYLADPALSASGLWTVHTQTPAHLRYAWERQGDGDDSTPAKAAGTAVHAAVFEPELFESSYVVLGQCEARTSKGTRCTNSGSVWRDGQSFCGVKGHDPHGKEVPMDPTVQVMTQAHRESAERMRDALMGHPTAGTILRTPGPREVVGCWRDEATGLWCRIRPDQLIEDAGGSVFDYSVVNLKSSGQDIGEEGFPRAAHRLGYYFKAALYRMGARELWGIEPQHFLYPVVEQSQPHAVIVYRLHEDALDVGEAEVRAALSRVAACLESGSWPAYGPEVHNLNLPEWRLRQIHSIDFLEATE